MYLAFRLSPPIVLIKFLNCDLFHMGTWCSGITPAQHAGGPGFNPQCVQFLSATMAISCSGNVDLHKKMHCLETHTDPCLSEFWCVRTSKRKQLAWFSALLRSLFTSTCGLVAMTSASHAEGRQFDPGQVYDLSDHMMGIGHKHDVSTLHNLPL